MYYLYHIIYKTTNLINGKYYIGKHSTNYLDDSYLGSGKLLTRAIRRYGKENFSKETLYIFTEEQQMIDKEIELVTEDLVNDKMSYNMALGGQGGNIFFKLKNNEYKNSCKKISDKNSGKNHVFYGKKRPEHSKLMKSLNLCEKYKKEYLITYENGNIEKIRGFRNFCITRGYNLGSMNRLLKNKKIKRHKDIVSIKLLS
jgi:hypothetical protein